MSNQPAQRIQELDALRGLAALAVVGFHFTTRFDELYGHPDGAPFYVPWGHYGVDLFFMISGFVILMTLDRTRGVLSFVWGRFSRLYPAYWAALMVTFLVVSLCGLPGQEVTLVDALLNLTMVQALLGAEHIDGAYWSLQAEIIFYVNMLVLHRLGCFRRPLKSLLAWLAVAAVAQGVLLAAENGLIGEQALVVSKLITVASLKYIPLFGIGILAYSWRCNKLRLPDVALGVVSCLAVAALFHGFASAAVALLLGAVLWAAAFGHAPWLGAQGLAYLGGLSYTLYLTHQNIGYVLMRASYHWGIGSSPTLLMACCVALLIAAALRYLVELPAMRWLRSQRRPAPDRTAERRLVSAVAG